MSQEQLTQVRVDAGADAFGPAQRVGEVLQAVASALREIPFGAVNGIGIRGITDLTVVSDAGLTAPMEAHARAVDTRELVAGGHLVVLDCHLTNRSGECVATFSVETEAEADVPVDPIATGGGAEGAASEPYLAEDVPV